MEVGVKRTFLGKEIINSDTNNNNNNNKNNNNKNNNKNTPPTKPTSDTNMATIFAGSIADGQRSTFTSPSLSVNGSIPELNGSNFQMSQEGFPSLPSGSLSFSSAGSGSPLQGQDRQGHLFRTITETFQKEKHFEIDSMKIPVIEKWKNLYPPQSADRLSTSSTPRLSSSVTPEREEGEPSWLTSTIYFFGCVVMWVLGWLEWIWDFCVLVADCLGSRETVKATDLTKISKLRQKEKEALSYSEWSKVVEELDVLEGKEAWKQDPKSRLYDYHLIQHRLSLLRGLSSLPTGYVSIKDALRAHLHRDLGGIGSRGLYCYSRIGTKQLILDYVDEVCAQLKNVMHSSNFTLEQKFDFFYETRQSYGRTALLLSGGASLGMYHLGVVKALFEQNLLPNIVSGASAGSIMTTIVGILTDEEMSLLWQPGTIDLRPFTRRKNGQFGRRIMRLLREGVLLDVRVLEEALRENIGDITFREAYLRSGKVINITVCSAGGGERPRLLNYLTAPNVLLWSAACASCALKFLYKPVELLSKDPDGKVRRYDSAGRKWSDGSVEEDLPMKRLSELFNVNHYIVSQVNPHVYPWVSTDNYTRENPSFFFSAKRVVRNLFLSEIKHRISQLVSIDHFNIFWSLAVLTSQTYTGDITIVPELKLSDFRKIITNPNEEYRMHCIKQAERLTWPFISVIRCHTDIEVTLETCYRLCQDQLSQPVHSDS